MARGLKKHLKMLNAPKHWMLDKLGGAFAPKPSSGPHKSRECLILQVSWGIWYCLYGARVGVLFSILIVVYFNSMKHDSFRLHSIRDEEAKEAKKRLAAQSTAAA